MTRLLAFVSDFFWVIVFWLSAAAYVAAQAPNPQCAPHASVKDGLARNYGEVSIAMGIAANGHLIEIFVSPETGSWRLVGTNPDDGISCMIAAGAAFASIPQGVLG